MRKLLFAVALAGCGHRQAATALVVVCDRSTSSTCTEGRIREAALAFFATQPPPGSRFTVLATGCGIDDVDAAYSASVPMRWGAPVAAKKRAWRAEQVERLDALALPARHRCSGIAAAIWRAGQVLGELPQANRRLIVISDLREVSRELGLNFERSIPKNFVATLSAAGLLPNLAGIEVEGCGVHDRRTPEGGRWTAAQARQLRHAWQVAFTAMKVKRATFAETCSFVAIGGDFVRAGEE